MGPWFRQLIAKITDTEDYIEPTPEPQEPANADDSAEVDVLCPICGMLVELMQHIERDDGKEYVTLRCLTEHYITLTPEDMELLIVEVD